MTIKEKDRPNEECPYVGVFICDPYGVIGCLCEIYNKKGEEK